MKAVSGIADVPLILRRHGWKLDRIRSSHFTYKKEGLGSITVPVHGQQDPEEGHPTRDR